MCLIFLLSAPLSLSDFSDSRTQVYTSSYTSPEWPVFICGWMPVHKCLHHKMQWQIGLVPCFLGYQWGWEIYAMFSNPWLLRQNLGWTTFEWVVCEVIYKQFQYDSENAIYMENTVKTFANNYGAALLMNGYKVIARWSHTLLETLKQSMGAFIWMDWK